MGSTKDAFEYANKYLKDYVAKVDEKIIELEKRISALESK